MRRSIHGRPLCRCRDLRSRYRAAHGSDEEKNQLAHLCGLVHDIGKIGLPPGLLEKPGALTLDERREMQEHTAIGERILANVEDYAEIAKIGGTTTSESTVRAIRMDSPGDEIPLLSRIIAVADAYNAMTSDRPYRDAMPSHVARMRLAQAVESQFDTDVVAAFEAILAGASEDYGSRRQQGSAWRGRRNSPVGGSRPEPAYALSLNIS